MLGEGHPAPARAHPNQSRAKRGSFGAPGSDSSVCIRGDTLGPRRRPAVSRRASSHLLPSRQQGLLCHSSPLPPSRRLCPGLVQSPQGLASASPRTVLLPTVPPFSPFGHRDKMFTSPLVTRLNSPQCKLKLVQFTQQTTSVFYCAIFL